MINNSGSSSARFFEYPPLLEPLDSMFRFTGTLGHDTRADANLGLYINIPFCRDFCSFCPYTKYGHSQEIESTYIAALSNEIVALKAARPELESVLVEEVFLGGGTPLALTPMGLASVLTTIRSSFNISESAEVSLEASPITVTNEKLRVLIDHGANRISVGAQSFSDSELAYIGSSHRRSDIDSAINDILKSSLSNYNIDMMYGFPSQTLETWQANLDKLVSIQSPHVSTYRFHLEPGTPLQMRGDITEAPSRLYDSMFDAADATLSQAGYRRYSAEQFARGQSECQYGYRTAYGQVLGLGAGSYSFYNSFLTENTRDLGNYFKRTSLGLLAAEFGKELTKTEAMERYLFKAVQFLSIDPTKFEDRFDEDMLEIFADILQQNVEEKWIDMQPSGLSVTSLGAKNIFKLSQSFFSDHYMNIVSMFPEYF